jgi:hypothetical protein
MMGAMTHPIPCIIAGGSVGKVGSPVIGRFPVQVPYLLTFWARADERSRNDLVD